MELAYTLHGAAPKVKDFQVAATAAAGVPLLIPAAGGAGLATATATSCADMVGVTLDSATFGTAQNADDSDPAAVVKVVINPDAVFRIKLAGSATTGAALTARTVSTASTDGLVVTPGLTSTNSFSARFTSSIICCGISRTISSISI